MICTGGGGIPTMYEPGTKTLVGAEVVIDKDRASALLAEQLDADLFVMATDVDAVYRDWGTPEQAGDRASRRRRAIAALSLPAGLDGPQGRGRRPTSSQRTGKRAAIGTLAELRVVVAGDARDTDRRRAVGAPHH